MARLSIVMIVKNEAQTITSCLDGLGWADEIVVLDSGSHDETVALARQFTEKVYIDNDWQGYGVQRQRAQKRATGDWVLMIDADERISPELKRSIQAALQQDDRNLAYSMAILPWCFGRFLRHGGWYPANKVRLYAKNKGAYGNQRVHEKLEFTSGVEVKRLKGDLLHYTYRNLEHYLTKSARYASEWAEERQQRGKQASLMEGLIHGFGCFMRMYIIRAGFLDGRQGFLMAVLSAHSTFVKYADLWTRNQAVPSVE